MNELVIEVDFEKEINLPPQKIREWISELEEKLSKLPQMELPITHHFSKGVYAREMKMEKGSMVIGKIHKFENLNILSQGEVTVLSIEGVKRVKAPHTFVAGCGVKRVIYAHEDTVWTTIHGTDKKNVDEIEEEFIAKNYDELPILEKSEVVWLGEQ